MITESERELLKAMQDEVLATMPHLQLAGETIPEEFLAHATGTPLAVIDALFAIREGEAWRGMTDPAEIARTVLRQMGVGE